MSICHNYFNYFKPDAKKKEKTKKKLFNIIHFVIILSKSLVFCFSFLLEDKNVVK